MTLRLADWSLALGLAVGAAACAVETTTGGVVEGNPGGGSTPPPCLGCDDAGAPAKVPAGSPTPSASPILATVDPNVTMNASPGEGVGVFSEYDTGGHWHLWWTCDTRITNESCPFDIKVSAVQGTITDPSTEGFTSNDTLVTPATPATGEAGAVEAKTVTTTGTSGLLFETNPGATITVSATVGGLYNGKFLFWVQGGKIDDGYRGQISDPLLLVGAAP